ncbi:MAG: RimK/LysX family protein [archaeon]
MGERQTLGLTEEITVLSDNSHKEKLIARIDTGATCSSIDDDLAERLNLGPVVRDRVVKSASGTKKRPLIMVTVEIKGKVIEAEFSIADRHHMKYPALIGQNVLKKGGFLVDPLKE